MTWSDEVWTFQVPDRGSIQVHRNPPLDAGLEVPLTLVLEDAGYWPADVRRYRMDWRSHTQAGEPDVVCGDAVCASLRDGQVVIRDLFDSWPEVLVPRPDFEAMLDAYYRYVVERAGGEDVDPVEGGS